MVIQRVDGLDIMWIWFRAWLRPRRIVFHGSADLSQASWVQFPSGQVRFRDLCLLHSIQPWTVQGVFSRRDAWNSVLIILFKPVSRSYDCHELIQATLCNQNNVLTWAWFPEIGCKNYAFSLLFRSFWGNFWWLRQKIWWNHLLWLWAKSLKLRSSHARLIVLAMCSSFARLPKICCSPGSSSKPQVHGPFGNQRDSKKCRSMLWLSAIPLLQCQLQLFDRVMLRFHRLA